MIKKHTPSEGFAFLYIVLIVAVIAVAVTFTMSETSIFGSEYIRTHERGAEVRALAMYCGEDLLMDVRDNPTITSSGTMSVGDGSCEFSVSGSDPNKTIDVAASLDGAVTRIQITTTQTSPIILAEWREVTS